MISGDRVTRKDTTNPVGLVLTNIDGSVLVRWGISDGAPHLETFDEDDLQIIIRHNIFDEEKDENS